MSTAALNQSVLTAFGEAVEIHNGGKVVQLTGMLRKAPREVSGPSTARRSRTEVVVKTSDLEGVCTDPQTPVCARGKQYKIVSQETGLHGLTVLEIRGSN